MDDGMVLRSVNLNKTDDEALRQLAFDRRVTKSQLIRAAIRAKLKEWRKQTSDAVLKRDLLMSEQPMELHPAHDDPQAAQSGERAASVSPRRRSRMKAPA